MERAKKNLQTDALMQHKVYQPSETHGPRIYFSCTDLAQELDRVVAAGGKVLRQKTEI